MGVRFFNYAAGTVVDGDGKDENFFEEFLISLKNI